MQGHPYRGRLYTDAYSDGDPDGMSTFVTPNAKGVAVVSIIHPQPGMLHVGVALVDEGDSPEKIIIPYKLGPC
jgi:hypothetical protein